MKTQSLVSDVTIQVSSEPVLTLPKQLSKQLGVRKGDQVSVQVRNGTLRIRKNGQRRLPMHARPRQSPRKRRTSSLMDWVGSIKSKSGKTICVEDYMTHHGYEQLERPGRKGY